MNSFWEKLPKPFLALAPMEDVTDSVLRQLIASIGAPQVMFTEFVNVDGIVNMVEKSEGILTHKEEIRRNGLMQRLYFTDSERPLVAQIWGSNPENFYKSAQVVAKLGFDGIDVNMGCPQRQVMKIGGCAKLISSDVSVRVRVSEIIQATKEGAEGLPVSVKTRIGNKKIITEDWIGFLLEQDLAAITVHGRTVAEQSKVPAHWDEIEKAASLREHSKHKTIIIGNGDVKDYQEAMEKAKQFGVDGIMIGRGMFSNPFCFKSEIQNSKIQINSNNQNIKPKINLFRKHIELYRETWGNKKSFYILRKFVKMYINGWEGASVLREKLMQAENYEELLHNLRVYES